MSKTKHLISFATIVILLISFLVLSTSSPKNKASAKTKSSKVVSTKTKFVYLPGAVSGWTDKPTKYFRFKFFFRGQVKKNSFYVEKVAYKFPYGFNNNLNIYNKTTGRVVWKSPDNLTSTDLENQFNGFNKYPRDFTEKMNDNFKGFYLPLKDTIKVQIIGDVREQDDPRRSILFKTKSIL